MYLVRPVKFCVYFVDSYTNLVFRSLQNEVEAGGGTRFTNLDMTVVPQVRPANKVLYLLAVVFLLLTFSFPGHFQVGRVLIWPSVYDSDPMNKDPRTMHEALPVEAGIKYGANGWIHMYDYLGPQSRGCN